MRSLSRPADMSWELFTASSTSFPDLPRAVLHGVGEPMLVKNLPRMVRYLKDRGIYVLFNTNGTVLNEKNGRALIDAGLDELRVSLDAANRRAIRRCAARTISAASCAMSGIFAQLQEREGHDAAARLGLADRAQGDGRGTPRLSCGSRTTLA